MFSSVCVCVCVCVCVFEYERDFVCNVTVHVEYVCIQARVQASLSAYVLCIGLLVHESLSSLSVVEDWDWDAPASLSGDAPVGPSVQHGQQAAPRGLWQNTHLLQCFLDKHTHTNCVFFFLWKQTLNVK